MQETNFFKQLQSDRQRWNFINEARISKKSESETVSLKNSIRDIIPDLNKILNLLNYRFSKLGDYVGSKQETFDEEMKTRVKANMIFKFQPITFYLKKILEKSR